MIIDLRFKKKLNNKYENIFNSVSKDSIKSFHDFISELSKTDNLDWWFSSPASRYTLSSPLFHHFCSFRFLVHLIKIKKIPKIIYTDSDAFYKIISKYLKNKNISIKVVNSNNYRLRLKLKINNTVTILNHFFYRLIQFYICNFLIKFNLPKKNNELILIDTYVFPNFIDKERYYNNLIESLTKKDSNKIFFVPTIVMFNFSYLYNVYKVLKFSKKKFIIKEQFYTLKNIFYAINHFSRKRKLIIKDYKLFDINIKNLVIEELKNDNLGFFSAVESFLTINFIKELKNKNIKISKAIDWFENRAEDKAWNYSFNKYMPNVKTLSYRGMIPSNMLLSEQYTLKIEKQKGFLANQIGVIGRDLIRESRKFNKLTNYIISPAFRFNHLWNNNKKDIINNKNNNNNNLKILIALPIVIEDSIKILKLIDSVNLDNNYEIVKFYVKSHPTNIKYMKNYIYNNCSKKFIYLEDPIYKIFNRINLLISGMSSVSLEGVASNLPVIIIKSSSTLEYTTIPNHIPNNLYKICNNIKDIKSSINFFITKTKKENILSKKLSKSILINNFEKISKRNIKEFIN